jgi:hypothetical protein
MPVMAFSQETNYTDWTTAIAGEVVLTFVVRERCMVSEAIKLAVNINFLDQSRYFLWSSS